MRLDLRESMPQVTAAISRTALTRLLARVVPARDQLEQPNFPEADFSPGMIFVLPVSRDLSGLPSGEASLSSNTLSRKPESLLDSPQ